MALINDKKDFIEIAESYGFKEITPQKNPHMISFKKEDDNNVRINYYFTTGTIQVQFSDRTKKPEIHRIVTLSKFEDILMSTIEKNANNK